MQLRHVLLSAAAFVTVTVPVITLSSKSALAGEDVQFTLVNGTTYTLVSFFASPVSIDSWENDILGRDTLPPGESVSVIINDGRDVCHYDVRADFSDHTSTVKRNVDFCNLHGGSYTFTEQ
jgi:hypothetical protein